MTDPEKMALKGAEYSPLNNISSGEELEQFSLPHPAPDRPKRRRKRKDFDSLKTSAVSAVRRNPVCSCCTCISIFMFVLLTSVVVGLAFTCVNLLQHVEEMQTQLDNLKRSKQTLDSELMSLRRYQETDQSTTQNITNHLLLMDKTLNKVGENFTTLKSKIDTIKVDHEQMSGVTAIKSLSDQIATFGSDIGSLNSDVLTLKQTSQSQSDVITGLQTKIQSLQTTTQSPDSHDSGSGASVDTANLSQKFTSLNMSVTSQLSAFTDVLSQYNSRYEQKIHSVERLETSSLELMNEIKDNVTRWMSYTMVMVGADNSTETVVQTRDNKTAELQTENAENVKQLADRVDKLETFVHQVSLQLQDRIVSETDSKVVNLTITTGMEDIIHRAFDTRYGELKDNLDEMKVHIATNQGHLSTLDQRFSSLTQTVFELHATVENLTKQTPSTRPPEVLTTKTDLPAANTTVANSDVGSNDTSATNETVSVENGLEAHDNHTILDTDAIEGNVTLPNIMDTETIKITGTTSQTISVTPPTINDTIADTLKDMSEDSLMEILKGLQPDTSLSESSTVSVEGSDDTTKQEMGDDDFDPR